MGTSAALSYYPRQIEDEVYHCGFASPKSYGASSYLIRRPDGNWLTDSPRYEDRLVDRFEAWGGIKYIFLTHRDDVADSDRYARRFGARRIIHEADSGAAPGAEIMLKGLSPSIVAPAFTAIPVPGHTRGHSVLLYRERFLFSGDHLAGDPKRGELEAWRDYCWFDWEEQTRSMERLARFRFEWVLPGHGSRLRLEPERMQRELAALVKRMKSG